MAYCILLILAWSVAVYLPDQFGSGQPSQAVLALLVLGIFQMLIALFDFASIGLNHSLLRLGYDEHRALWRALLGGLDRIVIFFVLGCLLITFITPSDGTTLMDLTQPCQDSKHTQRLCLVDAHALLQAAAHRIPSLPHSSHHGAKISRTGSQNSEQVFEGFARAIGGPYPRETAIYTSPQSLL